MKKKFYVATTLLNFEQADYVADKLIQFGFEQTYRWTIHGPAGDKGEEFLKEICTKEMNGVKEADFVVVILPAARGTHVEIGIALANKIPIFLVNPLEPFDCNNKTCGFYWVDGVTRMHCSLDEAVKTVYNSYKSKKYIILKHK